MAVRGVADPGTEGITVTSVSGTANEITVSPTTGAVVASLPTALTFTGKTVTGGTYIPAGAVTFSVATSGVVLKQGANGLCGTFIANGATPVAVSNTNVAITDCIIISLNTAGGTVGVVPPTFVSITATTGFSIKAQTLDTSTYNYAIIKNVS